MLQLCRDFGLREPEFKSENIFRTIIWRRSVHTGEPTGEVSGEATGEVSGEATGELSEEVRRVVLVIRGEVKRVDIQELLQLKHQEYFRDHYLLPAIQSGYVEMTFPDNPNHPKQRYRLTPKGKELVATLKE
jgi:ATP-dependent DNA helicase RecG